MRRLGGGQVAVVGKHAAAAAAAIDVVAGALAWLHLDGHKAGAVAVVTHAVAAAGQGGAGGVWVEPPAAGGNDVGRVVIAVTVEDGNHGGVDAAIHCSMLLRMTGAGRIGLQMEERLLEGDGGGGGAWTARMETKGGAPSISLCQAGKYFTESLLEKKS